MIWHWLAVEMLVVMLLVPACATQPATTAGSTSAAPTGAAGTSPGGGSDARDARDARGGSSAGGTLQPVVPGGRGEVLAPAVRPTPEGFKPLAELRADLRDVHFDFDKYEIRPGDATILDGTAGWLNANRNYVFLVEGHCDERGTDEYNVVLGERRARAVVNYLSTRGVAATRATVLSLGKERPLCKESEEACWAKNRRARLLVKEQ